MRAAGFAWLPLLAIAVAPACADQIILPANLSRDGSVAVVYRLDPPAAGNGTLAVEWTDADQRLVAQIRLPVGAGQTRVSVPLDLRRAVATSNHLHTHLALSGAGAAPARATDADVSFFVPPADRGWDDYQLIMWQPHDAGSDEALKSLGVTASTVHGYHDVRPPGFFERQDAPLLASDLRWYVENIATDFYSAYHRWFPDKPVNWRFVEAKRLYQQDPMNPAAFLRDPSLSDPVWLEKIRRRLLDTVAAQRRYRPLFYNLADEAGIAELSVAWDFDFSTASLDGLRRWLRGQYGTLAALNRQWGTRFTAWRQIMPMTTRAAIRRGDGNYSAWADFKAWMDVAFARALAAGTAAVHAGDPAARAAIEGTQISGWGGYDYSRLATAVDVMEVYDDGENLDAARAFNPKLVVLTTAFGGGAQEIHDIWRELLRGTRGLVLWDPKGEIVADDGTVGARGRADAATFRAITGGLGALLIGSRRQDDPVAILYSPASLRTQWLLDWRQKGDAWSDRDADSDYEDANEARSSLNGFLTGLDHAGLQPHLLSPETLAAGALRRSGDRVLILPRAVALSAAEAVQIHRFLAGGGTVIADGEPGIFDQHSRRLPKPALADVFRTPPDAAPGRFTFGRGSAFYLSPGAGAARLAQAMATAGVVPAFHLTQSDGHAPADVETTLRRDGNVLILSLQRDFAAAGTAQTSETLTLILPRAAYLYDLRQHRQLGRSERVTLALDPVEPTLLAIADRPLPSLAIAAPARLRLGETGALHLRLAQTSPAALDIFHVALTDPAGKPAAAYSGNLVARNGAAAPPLPLPLALNDAAGQWKIAVTDMLSGETASSSLEVSPR